MSQIKSWNKLSISADSSTLENISAYFKHIMLGIEQSETSWSLFFNIDDREKVSDILLELNNHYNFKNSPIEVVNYDDWHLKWKDNFHPIIFGKKLIIIPDWDDNKYSQDHTVKIKPGMSFGTGHHETTSLMIEALLNTDINDKKVLDLGFGSGILSIISKKLGSDNITSIELDEICRDDIQFNMNLNSISDGINIYFKDARLLADYNYDIILANIEKNIIMDLIPLIKVKNSKVILSGILTEQEEEVNNELLDEGFINISITRENEWACFTADFC